jgi:hypothetical protein
MTVVNSCHALVSIVVDLLAIGIASKLGQPLTFLMSLSVWLRPNKALLLNDLALSR